MTNSTYCYADFLADLLDSSVLFTGGDIDKSLTIMEEAVASAEKSLEQGDISEVFKASLYRAKHSHLPFIKGAVKTRDTYTGPHEGDTVVVTTELTDRNARELGTQDLAAAGLDDDEIQCFQNAPQKGEHGRVIHMHLTDGGALVEVEFDRPIGPADETNRANDNSWFFQSADLETA